MIVQPDPPPGSRAGLERLVREGRMIDLAGRPLGWKPCPHCGTEVLGSTTCPSTVRCPSCCSTAKTCRRPSGHEAAWHAERVAAAEAEDDRREAAGDLTLPARWPSPSEQTSLF